METLQTLCAELINQWDRAPTPSDFIDTDGYGMIEKIRVALKANEPTYGAATVTGVRVMTDFRALCRELIALVERCPVTSDSDWIADRNDLIVRFHAAEGRPAARAALAEPVPEDDVALLREALANTAAQRRAEDDARAALAEPEPEVAGPSDEELRDLWSLAAGQDQGPWPTQQHWFARAVLARWGRYDPPAAGAPCPPMEDVGPLIAWLAEQACQAADASQSTDAGMLTWAAQVIGELVDEDAPAPPAAGEPSAKDLLPAEPPDIPTTMAMQYRSAWREGVEDGWNEARAFLASRAAELLEQRHPEPVPVAERLPELRGMFERILCVARSSGQRPVGNIELADRLIGAVVSWAALPLPAGEEE